MPDKRFAKTTNDVIDSTLRFFEQPEYWREAVGPNPKYFTHFVHNGKHHFGLSKYCAFRNVRLSQYVLRLRNTTNGNITQRHISKVTGVAWIPFSRSSLEVRRAFSDWIRGFFPGYRLNNASFLTLKPGVSRTNRKGRGISHISPDDLQKKLRRQTKIGKVGEVIALRHEIARLKQMGVSHPEQRVDHVSKRNSAAGFDIWSRPSTKTVRFIEVKSSTSDSGSFFITKNEVDTLRQHGSSAYLYFVHVKNLGTKQGDVILELSNPVKRLETYGTLEPTLFRAEVKNKQ